jgi:uncharacterized BrkB/YihY/UPF0761 family membrane protein
VTQTVQQAMAGVWNIPKVERPGFGARLARSLTALVIIGAAFVANAAAATFVTNSGTSYAVKIPALLGMVVLNVILYAAVFRVATPRAMSVVHVLPGSTLSALGFTLLISLGSGLVQHQLRHTSATYGEFGVVIGLVGFLFLLAKISLYGAELNPVLTRRLWPRGLLSGTPTPADNQVLADIAHAARSRDDERIGVGFGENAETEAAIDARGDATSRGQGVQ